jgi:hypothetical protein
LVVVVRDFDEDESLRELVEALLEPPREVFFGTLAPFFRASDNPIAIACFAFFTLRPDLPDSSLPRFILCMARSTLFDALGPYVRGIVVYPLPS